MPSSCIDEVLRRAFASEYTELYESNYNPANPNIKTFPRNTVPLRDDTVPEPILYLVAECSFKESILRPVDNDSNVGESV